MTLLETRDPAYVYQPIAYQDSWISVDPIVGCPASCAYCYLQATGWTRQAPEMAFSVSSMVDALTRSPFFEPDRSVLSFGNQTDPFYERNVPHTWQFVEELERRRFRNPLILVTKRRVPEDFLRDVRQLAAVHVVFGLSYSGLPARYEEGVSQTEAEGNWEHLAASGCDVVHFWRPLTHENGTRAALEAVLNRVARYSRASAYHGLALARMLEPVYDASGWSARRESLTGSGYLPAEVEANIQETVIRLHPEYPVFKRTSCAVSYVLGQPDYNATMFEPEICLASNCPASQRRICAASARSRPTCSSVRSALDRAGVQGAFTIEDDCIEVDAQVTQEQFAFILHSVRYPVAAPIRPTRNTWGAIFASAERLVRQRDGRKGRSALAPS